MDSDRNRGLTRTHFAGMIEISYNWTNDFIARQNATFVQADPKSDPIDGPKYRVVRETDSVRLQLNPLTAREAEVRVDPLTPH